MDASDQRGVSHVKLRHGPEGARAHGEGVEHAPVVSSPHLAAAVAHGQQVGAQLGGRGGVRRGGREGRGGEGSGGGRRGEWGGGEGRRGGKRE